ncbi:uncharacterized protein MKZ38_006765 [Zalerion maritima]|uniref:Uncharacterized protein n=1 Tax=Zalerion maritima TaxID=339359 RepID=A0AAD5WPH6_9PEZI|nr:uncharacterized protein MKZ38_006765 [Zalerion maritima]
MPPRKEQSFQSVSSSWRMVDGDGNDSFDTSVVRDACDDIEEEDFIPSSQATNPASSFNPTGPVSSFDVSLGSSSQDSISNYLNTADDEQLLRRTGAFRPSVPPAARRQPTSPLREQSFNRYDRDDLTPEPQFRFPRVEVESPRKGGSSRTSSTRTIRPTTYMAPEEAAEFRRRTRVGGNSGSPLKPRQTGQEEPGYNLQLPMTHGPSIRDRLATSVPHGMLDIVGWLFKILALAFNILAPIFAVLLAFGLLTLFASMMWSLYEPAITSALSPICKVPGVGYLDIPFCGPGMKPIKPSMSKRKKVPIEFDDLMSVQSQFETVLEETSSSVSLPLEMKRSESSIRDLRTLVKTSKLEAKDSLGLEFDGFIGATSKSADGLTQFTVEVGTAVDRILLINKNTMRYIDNLLPAETDDSASGGIIELIMHTVFGTKRHSRAWSEEMIRKQYIEHTYSVTERIESLLVQAQAVLRDLNIAEGHLSVILEIVATESGIVKEKQDEVRPSLWSLWGLVGGSRSQTKSLQAQLDLLRMVDFQRSSAVDKLNRLVMELKEMKARLADLRDRVTAPSLAEGLDGERSTLADVPLSIHIETINRGVERLEDARMRIRSEQDDRVQEVLQRGKTDDNLIDEA